MTNNITKLFEKYEEDIIKEFESKTDVGTYQPLLEKLRELLLSGNSQGIKSYIEVELKDFDFSFLKHLYDSSIITVAYSKDIHSSIDERDYERLELEVLKNSESPIITLDKDFTFQHTKEIILKLYEDFKLKPFLISKSNKIKGRVVYQMYDSMKRISLVQEFVEKGIKEDKSYLKFIGDTPSKRAPDSETSRLFYFHHFTDENEDYILVHDERIKPQQCIVEGMVIPLSDDVKIGESLSIGGTKKLLIVHTLEKTEKELTEKEVKEYTKDWTAESLIKKVFGEFRHPTMYEWLHISWLLSSKFAGYPLHLLVFGPNASGKTTGIIKPTTHVVPDPKPGVFIDGANTTLKGIAPSYAGSKLSPGLFIIANRICYVDEFLKAVKRSPRGTHGEQSGLESFTSMLEHQPSIVGSGNTQPTNLVATAKALFTTNPERGLEDLLKCNQELTTPAMARFLTYVQTKEHVDFVTDNMARVSSMKITDAMPKYDPTFINIYDFCNAYETKFDFVRIKKIKDKIQEIVPEGLSEMYRGRYLHHLILLLDGVSKFRWLCNEKETLEVTDEDYNKAEALMYFVIQSWKERINFNEIPKYLWKEYLTVEERNLYEEIKLNDGEKFVDEIKDSTKLKKLLDIEIVINKGGYLYTHDSPYVWSSNSIINID